MKKVTKWLKAIFQRRYTNDEQIHEKVVSTINQQENKSQNHNEISFHIYKDVYIHKDKREEMSVRMWIKGNTCTVLVRILTQLLWKIVWRLLKGLEMKLQYEPAIPLLSTYPQEMKSVFQRYMCTSMFVAVLFTIAKVWKHSKCP